MTAIEIGSKITKSSGFKFLGDMYDSNENGNAGPLYKRSEYIGSLYYNKTSNLAAIVNLQEYTSIVLSVQMIENAGSNLRKCGGCNISASSHVQYYTWKKLRIESDNS